MEKTKAMLEEFHVNKLVDEAVVWAEMIGMNEDMLKDLILNYLKKHHQRTLQLYKIEDGSVLINEETGFKRSPYQVIIEEVIEEVKRILNKDQYQSDDNKKDDVKFENRTKIRVPKKYQHMLELVEKDGDGYWAYAREGYIFEGMGCRTAHEYTQKELLEMIRTLIPEKQAHSI